MSHARIAIIADLLFVCAPALTVPETAGGLPTALAAMPGPRARRGVRHQLSVVVTAAVCAVVAGYRSYAAIAEWVADVPATTVLSPGHRS